MKLRPQLSGTGEAGQEVVGGPSDLIFKQRAQWHTFWNAGDEPAVVMEIISPGGLEEFFKSFAELPGPVDPIELKEKAAAVAHVDIDLDATFPIIQRHGLVFRLLPWASAPALAERVTSQRQAEPQKGLTPLGSVQVMSMPGM